MDPQAWLNRDERKAGYYQDLADQEQAEREARLADMSRTYLRIRRWRRPLFFVFLGFFVLCLVSWFLLRPSGGAGTDIITGLNTVISFMLLVQFVRWGKVKGAIPTRLHDDWGDKVNDMMDRLDRGLPAVPGLERHRPSLRELGKRALGEE